MGGVPQVERQPDHGRPVDARRVEQVVRRVGLEDAGGAPERQPHLGQQARDAAGMVGLPVKGLHSAFRSIKGFTCCPGRAVVVVVDCDIELPGLLGFKNVDNGASSSDEDSLDESDVSVSFEGACLRGAFCMDTILKMG